VSGTSHSFSGDTFSGIPKPPRGKPGGGSPEERLRRVIEGLQQAIVDVSNAVDARSDPNQHFMAVLDRLDGHPKIGKRQDGGDVQRWMRQIVEAFGYDDEVEHEVNRQLADEARARPVQAVLITSMMRARKSLETGPSAAPGKAPGGGRTALDEAPRPAGPKASSAPGALPRP